MNFNLIKISELRDKVLNYKGYKDWMTDLEYREFLNLIGTTPRKDNAIGKHVDSVVDNMTRERLINIWKKLNIK